MSNSSEIIDKFINQFNNAPAQVWTIPYVEILGSFFVASLISLGAIVIYGSTKKWEPLVPYLIFTNIFLAFAVPFQFFLLMMIFTIALTGGLFYKIFIQREGTRL